MGIRGHAHLGICAASASGFLLLLWRPENIPCPPTARLGEGSHQPSVYRPDTPLEGASFALSAKKRGLNDMDENHPGDAHITQKGDGQDLKTDTQAHTQFPELKFNRGSEKRKGPVRAEERWKDSLPVQSQDARKQTYE